MTNATLGRLHEDATAIFQSAITAADPTALVSCHLARRGTELIVQTGPDIASSWTGPTLVIGAGKAAARMAVGCERVMGPERVSGLVIVAEGCGAVLESIAVAEAGHPLPDPRGEDATRRLVELVASWRSGGVLCLISGGASSLLVSPRPPVTLADKIRTNQLLLEFGADIGEINTVRKHLSLVKGGGLLRLARAPMAALLISDVIGDDPSTIGSAPTAPDGTTYHDAWAVLERYELTARVPGTVAQLLKAGMEGRVPETVRPGSAEAARCCNVVVGSNRTALEGAAREARRQGWNIEVMEEPLVGDTTEVARAFGVALRQRVRLNRAGLPLCVLAGGETTVRVRGTGRGGRNQEFALVLASELEGEAVCVLSAGSDGIDGPTRAAGAFVDGTTGGRARERGLTADAFLTNNDSYTFFRQLGDLFECGPTGTNVMDIKIALLAEPFGPVCGPS